MNFAEIEAQRAAHEELERIEAALVERFEKSPWLVDGAHKSRRITALQRLEAKALIDRYDEVYKSLRPAKYEKLSQGDALAEFETAIMPAVSHNVASMYSIGVKHGLQQYMCKYTSDKINIEQIFTPAERYGEFLDLHGLYAKYMSLTQGSQTYPQFLESFPQMDAPIEYLQDVCNYLRDFYSRTRVFDEPPTVAPVEDPLYCTSCQRLFSSQGVFDGHLNGKKHKRALSGGKRPTLDATTLALSIQEYSKLLATVLEQTRADAIRQSYLTEKERIAEMEQLALAAKREDEGIPDVIDSVTQGTSAIKMPLGPDGRPIPHWLYKLHGLGQEFPCEICGNYIYHGRKAFDRHFHELRHAHGLKCLGIEAPGALKGITNIQEAVDLAKKLNQNSAPDAEVEDDEGNVMTEKVYKDLKKQGLI